MTDNVIPFIKGEEEKSEQEPLKIWGAVVDGRIANAEGPTIADSKPFVLAYLQRKPPPLLSTDLQKKLRAAAIKCLTPEQQKAVGAA